MKRANVLCLSLLTLLAIASPSLAADSTAVDLKAIWNSLTPEERAAHEAEGRRLAATVRPTSSLTPGDTCAAATHEVGTLPFNDADTTVGLTDDTTYGAACGGFNGSSGVGPDIAYRIRTDINCGLTVNMDPAAADLALWVVTNCADPVGGCIGGDDSGGNGTLESVSFAATAGTDYFIVVDGFGGASDAFTLNIVETTATGCQLVGPSQPGYGSAPSPPGPIAIGSVVVGNTGSVDLTISETGTASLSVTNPVLGGANPGDFGVEALFPLTILDGGAAVPVEISCTPTAAGPRAATLTLTTNDPTQPSVLYNLTCDGTAVPAGYGSIPAPPGPIDVGQVGVGGSGSVNLTMQETGSADLTVSNPVIGGANAADFSVEALFPLTILDGGAAVQVEVTCTPSALGPLVATLSFNTNDPTQTTVLYDLACEGVEDTSILEIPTLSFWGLALLGLALAAAGMRFLFR
jgi:hypothetical protein